MPASAISRRVRRRAELAQGGGPDAKKIDEALERGLEVLRESLAK